MTNPLMAIGARRSGVTIWRIGLNTTEDEKRLMAAGGSDDQAGAEAAIPRALAARDDNERLSLLATAGELLRALAEETAAAGWASSLGPSRRDRSGRLLAAE